MNAIFLDLVNRSITAGYVILAVMLIRVLLRKAPKKYSYMLWSVVGFRLCIPFSFSTVFSLFSLNLGKKTVVAKQYGSAIQYVPEQMTLPEAVANEAGTKAADTVLNQTNAFVSGMVQDNSRMQSLVFAGMMLWLIGMAVFALYSVVSYVRLQKRMDTAVLLEENVYQSDRVASPFIMGFLKPRIYIPFGLEEKVLRYVLTHEKYHLKRCDHLIKLFAFALLAVYWFHPLCWLAYCMMCMDMEMSCDEKVLAGEPDISKSYSLALLSFATNRRLPVPGPLSFGENGVKERIKNVLGWKRCSAWIRVMAAVLCVATVIGCAGNPKEDSMAVDKDVVGAELSEIYTKEEMEAIYAKLKELVKYKSSKNFPNVAEITTEDVSATREKVYHSIEADVTHDGIPDQIVLFGAAVEDMDMEEDAETFFAKTANGGYVRIYDGRDEQYDAANPGTGTPIWERMLGYAHAGNGQISITKQGDLEYLLISSMWEGQGQISYHAQMLALDGEGRQHTFAEYYVDFGGTEETEYRISDEHREDLAEFREQIKPLYEGAYLLIALDISDEKGVYISDENRSYQAEEYYNSVWKRYEME